LEEAPSTNDGEAPAGGKRRTSNRGERDSNPAVRQRVRQQDRLRALNAGA